MTRVAIVGLGTVGGSLGMALQQAVSDEPARRGELFVVGYDEDYEVQLTAQRKKAVDRGANSLEEAVQEADIVVIATATGMVGETLQTIAPLLQPGCVVTDTASSKAQVLHWAKEFLSPEVSFVGGHPVFAPHYEVDWEAGIAGATADLFQGAIYCLVPAPNASKEAVETIHGMVDLIGASPYFLDALEVDGLLAGVSHVPYVLAAVMLHTIASSPSWRELKLLADSSFRHLSWPVAARQDEFHQACQANRLPVISWLDRVIAALQEVRRELADETSAGDTLATVLKKAGAARQDWIRRRDERESELDSKAMSDVETPGQQLVRMFVPRSFFRRRFKEEGEEK